MMVVAWRFGRARRRFKLSYKRGFRVAVLSRIVAVFGTAMALLIMASGISSADYSGQTYGTAVQQINSWGGKAVIASVVGDQLAIDDCIVTSSKNPKSNGGGTIQLHLNCNAALAIPGSPGNSAASPEGKAAKETIATAQWCALPAQVGTQNCDDWCSYRTAVCKQAAADAEQAVRMAAIKDKKTAEWCALPAQVGTQNCADWCSTRAELCEEGAKVVTAKAEQPAE